MPAVIGSSGRCVGANKGVTGACAAASRTSDALAPRTSAVLASGSPALLAAFSIP